MMPHQERVVTEKKELDEKIGKLNEFILSNPVFARLPEDERKRLSDQHFHMKNYSDILGARIAAF